MQAHLEHRCAAGDPASAPRGARRLPRLDLQQLQPSRAALGQPQGVGAIATHYEKTPVSFMGALCLAAAPIGSSDDRL